MYSKCYLVGSKLVTDDYTLYFWLLLKVLRAINTFLFPQYLMVFGFLRIHIRMMKVMGDVFMVFGLLRICIQKMKVILRGM